MFKALRVIFVLPVAALAAYAPEPAPAVAPRLAVLRLVSDQPRAPAPLAARIEALGQRFDGDIGIAVRDLDAGWTAGWQDGASFPQQSVSKLWVALAALDRVDRGEIALSDTVLIARDDLSVFHQPIRAKVGQAGYQARLDELLTLAIAKSDNAANDFLMRQAGGPEAVQAVLREKGLGDIRVGPPERVLQSRIAALDWRPEYSFGHAFHAARSLVPWEVREEAMAAYLSDPMDAATPADIALALGRLQKGELLSKASTARLLGIMERTETGPSRLRAGLPPGWTIAHKTGTGQVLGRLHTGFNDVGILTAPDGQVYTVAVMIGSTRVPVPERQQTMSEVVRAVVAYHEGRVP